MRFSLSWTIVGVLLICINSFIASAEPQNKSKNSIWYSCKEPSDCALAKGICGGPTPVNKEFQRDFEKWAAATRSKVRCAKFLPSTDWPSDLVPTCKNGECTAETSKKGDSK